MATSSAPTGSLADRARAPLGPLIPPADLGLIWRHLTLGDVPALAALVADCEEVDGPPFRTAPHEVAEWLTGSWKDLRLDTLGGFDPQGQIRAFALVEVFPGDVSTIRAHLHGGVHPAVRGRAVGRALVAWMDARGRQLLAESGKDAPGRLLTHLEADDDVTRRLYAAAGFTPRRWYTTMRRNLDEPSPEVRLAVGLRLVRWSPDVDDAVRRAHNEAFADHWGSEPRTPEQWRAGRSTFAPEWSFAVVDDAAPDDDWVPDDDAAPRPPAVAGYLISDRFEQDWPALGYSFGYVDLLGVRRAWRGRALAVVLLAAAIDAFRADGIEHAVLDVDTENPTGAHGLYTRVGFEPIHGSVMYTIEV